jgi:hypothetical protein
VVVPFTIDAPFRLAVGELLKAALAHVMVRVYAEQFPTPPDCAPLAVVAGIKQAARVFPSGNALETVTPEVLDVMVVSVLRAPSVPPVAA